MFKNRLLKYLVCSVLAVLIVSHIVQMFFTKPDLSQFSLIIFTLIFIAVFKENKIMYSFSFISMGILCILTLPELANLGAVPIFFIAMLYCSKPIILSSIFVSIISSYLINYYLTSGTNYINLIEGILGNIAFLAGFYFSAITKLSENKKVHRKIDDMEPIEKAIMDYVSIDGYTQKEIAAELNNPENKFYDEKKKPYSGDMIYGIIKNIREDLTPEGEVTLVTEQVIRILTMESEKGKRKTVAKNRYKGVIFKKRKTVI